ncbi:MAG: DUF5058 family protein [Oscillospiraceae bacterium]|nr:DUF5058 family protein [Oscillospiraceae bacterium]
MTILSQLNSPAMYLICGGAIAVVALICVVFMVRAYRAGLAIGMDAAKMRRVIIASTTFTILPAVGILLGVIALAGSLGTPLPWLRLSVIGALHYETQVAQGAAENVGLSGLNAAEMTATAFSTIALVMSACIMGGILMSIFFTKRYTKRLGGNSGGGGGIAGGFGDKAMTAMFIGLVSAYVGNYVGQLVSGEGLFTFSGSWTPIAVMVVAAIAMAVFIYLAEKKQAAWVENFSIAGSMLCGMIAAILIG